MSQLSANRLPREFPQSKFRPLRIAVATSGRFHALDLARELSAQGHEVTFYSMVPMRRAVAFGLPATAHRWLPELLPFAAVSRFGPQVLRSTVERCLYASINRALRARLEPCDVFIGMSGLILEAAAHARRQFGARIVLERGSRHIQSQAEILAAIPGAEKVSQYAIDRELAGYELADIVTVPSIHAEQSFLELDFPQEKLFRNPYGVDLKTFVPVETNRHSEQSVICFVGRWSLRKGCDLIIDMIKRNPGMSLLHAGAIGDIAMPNELRFLSLGHVDQSRLPEIYAQASIAVLPSREEGLAMVLAQALACGVPIVCSDRSGGEDLRLLIVEKEAVSVVSATDPQAFESAVNEMLLRSQQLRGRDLLGKPGRKALSWAAYGRRYSEFLARFGIKN